MNLGLVFGLASGRGRAYRCGPPGRVPARIAEKPRMHYPKRTSNVKRRRQLGFRARMKTRSGRKLINARRRRGRKIAAKGL